MSRSWQNFHFLVKYLFKLVLWDIHSFCTLAKAFCSSNCCHEICLRALSLFALAIQKPFRKLWQMHTHQLKLCLLSICYIQSRLTWDTFLHRFYRPFFRINRDMPCWPLLLFSTFWPCSSFAGDYSSHTQPVHFQGICHGVRCSHGHWEIDGWSGTSGAWINF